jgi:hypothetical protein
MVNWDNDPTAARVPQPAYGGFDNLSPDWFDESAPTTNGRRAGEEWGVDRVMGQFVWE